MSFKFAYQILLRILNFNNNNKLQHQPIRDVRHGMKLETLVRIIWIFFIIYYYVIRCWFAFLGINFVSIFFTENFNKKAMFSIFLIFQYIFIYIELPQINPIFIKIRVTGYKKTLWYLWNNLVEWLKFLNQYVNTEKKELATFTNLVCFSVYLKSNLKINVWLEFI